MFSTLPAQSDGLIDPRIHVDRPVQARSSRTTVCLQHGTPPPSRTMLYRVLMGCSGRSAGCHPFGAVRLGSWESQACAGAEISSLAVPGRGDRSQIRIRPTCPHHRPLSTHGRHFLPESASVTPIAAPPTAWVRRRGGREEKRGRYPDRQRANADPRSPSTKASTRDHQGPPWPGSEKIAETTKYVEK